MVNSINIPVTSCIVAPTQMQNNIVYYYKQISPYINSYLNTAQTKELFGKDPDIYYNYINDIYYLLLFISVVNDERQMDVNNGISNTCNYYSDQFICIVNYFKCLNVNITPLLAIFGFVCTIPAPQPGNMGIGVMEIDNNINNEIFTVSVQLTKLSPP